MDFLLEEKGKHGRSDRKEHFNSTTKLSNGGTLDREPLYNHLGTILHELGTCKMNIERRIFLAVTAAN